MFTPTYSTIDLIAREKIEAGDCVVFLWGNYVRLAQQKDLDKNKKISVAKTKAKKGKIIKVFAEKDMLFDVDVKI